MLSADRDSFPEPAARWSALPWLALLLAVAVFPRVVGLPGEILSHDELASWRYGQGSLSRLLASVAALDCHPPLFYLLQWVGESLLGPGVGSRLPVLLASLAGIPAIFALGVAWFDRRTGLLAAALLALNPWHVHLARDARMYSLLFFLACLLFSLLPAARRGETPSLFAASFVSTLLLFTHYFAAWFVLAALAVLAAPGGEAGWRNFRRRLPVCLVLPLGLFLAWLGFVFFSLQARGHFPLTWGMLPVGWGFLFDFLEHSDWSEPVSYFRWVFFAAASPLLLLLPRFRRAGVSLLLLLLWLPLLGQGLSAGIIAFFSGAGSWQASFAVPCLAPLLVLVARSVLLLRPQLLLVLVLAALLLRPADSLASRGTAPSRNPWPSLLANVASLQGESPLLVVSPPGFLDDLAAHSRRGIALSACEADELPRRLDLLQHQGYDPLVVALVVNAHYTAGPRPRFPDDLPEGWHAATLELRGERHLEVQIRRPRDKELFWRDAQGQKIPLPAGSVLPALPRPPARAEGIFFSLIRRPGVLDLLACGWWIGILAAGIRLRDGE